MSIKHVNAVWESGLTGSTKSIALKYADFANHDGKGIYPSIAYMSWLTGYGKRTVSRAKSELLEMGVLVKVREYIDRPDDMAININKLPKRETWQEYRIQNNIDEPDISPPMPNMQDGTDKLAGGDMPNMQDGTDKLAPYPPVNPPVDSLVKGYATIDDLGSRRNAGIHPPLSTLESFILGSIESELKTHSLANWVFKVVNGKQVNVDAFKAFCEGVDKDTFIADLQSIVANWSNTGFARNNHPPTIGRILSVWNDDSAKSSREFEALVVPLQRVIKRDKAEARVLVQTAAYAGIKATMQRNGINFDFVETARKEQWEKLK